MTVTTRTARLVALAAAASAGLALGVAAGPAEAQATKAPAGAKKVYRWVDDKGQVHYGDSVPPEYASQDAEVLNRQGVPVSRIEGNETPEELALRKQQDLAVKRAAQQKQRDRVLLQTYLSVQEIERLRDSRLEVIDSQIVIQQQYMSQLKQKRDRQLKMASVYTPYSKDPEAEELPPELANDLARSDADLRTQQANLEKKRAERVSLKTRFDLDIARFKELKGMKPGTAPAPQAVPARPPTTG
jgi:Domain of unknown function (DUF4124)